MDVDRRWAEALRKSLGLTGGKPLNVLDDLFPVLNLTTDCPEWSYIRDERPFTTGVITRGAGAAGTYARVSIRNPADSNRLVVLRRVATLRGATAGTIIITDPGATATPISAMPRDSRSTIPILLSGADAPAGTGVQRWQFQGLSSWTQFDTDGLVLAPGAGIGFQTVTAIEGLSVNIEGYDVPLHGYEGS